MLPERPGPPPLASHSIPQGDGLRWPTGELRVLFLPHTPFPVWDPPAPPCLPNICSVNQKAWGLPTAAASKVSLHKRNGAQPEEQQSLPLPHTPPEPLASARPTQQILRPGNTHLLRGQEVTFPAGLTELQDTELDTGSLAPFYPIPPKASSTQKLPPR